MQFKLRFPCYNSEPWARNIGKHLMVIRHKLRKPWKKIIKKIAAFLRELKTCPTTGTGQVKPLSNYGVRSVWSRRIDKKHRLIYEVFEEEKIVKLGVFLLLLSVFVSCSDIMEMVKRDLQIESQRAAADSRNNPY